MNESKESHGVLFLILTLNFLRLIALLAVLLLWFGFFTVQVGFFVNMHCQIVLVLFVFSMRIHTYNFTLYFVFPPNFIGMPCRCRRFLKKYEKKRRSVGAMLLLRIEWTRRCNIIFDAVFFYNFPGFVCSQILHFFP